MNKLLSVISIEHSQLKCFLCNTIFSDAENTFLLFGERTSESYDCSLASILSSILGRQLEEESVHSKIVCQTCYNQILEYEQLEQRFFDIKYGIVQTFNKTARAIGEPIVALEEEIEENEEYNISLDDRSVDEVSQNDIDPENDRTEIVDNETVELMDILCAEKIAENFNSDNGEKQIIKVESFHTGDDGGYYEETNENLVEVMSEDVHYEQIIEHHPQGSNDSNIENDNEINLTIPPGIFIKMENENVEIDEDYSPGAAYKRKRKRDNEKLEDRKPLFIYDGEKYSCITCAQGGESSSLEYDSRTIAIHLKSVHNIRVYICDICGVDFRKRTELTEHMDEDHGGTEDGEFQCETCNRIFTNLRLFRIHKRLHHTSSKSFSCNQCNKKYSSKNLRDEHMNMHTGDRPYKCNHCSKDFASKYTLTAHLKIHSDRPRPFNCKTCPKAFFSAQNLQQHEKTHSGVKEFICKVCHKAFGTQHNLEVHKVVHTGYKPFICRTCGKAFARRAEINDHERTHSGEKPFTCDICNMSFAQRSNLTTHKRATHFNDKRYKCQECDRSFKRRRLLDYHIRATHTGERPYKCDLCSATFVYPEHYKKHLRIHTGVKPYACEVCGKTFNSRDNRNAHRFIHSDKKPYECLVCGQGFMRKPLLFAHMQHTGHVNDTIVINQPRITNELEEKSEDIYLEEHINEESEMVEEHLIIDGPVQFGQGNNQDNSVSNEILEEDIAEVITGDEILVTEEGQYMKSEDGSMKILEICTKNQHGKDGFAWVNFVSEKNS